jgi:ribosome maturation factor RimP
VERPPGALFSFQDTRLSTHVDNTRSLIAAVRRLAEPLAEARGCEVVAVEAVGAPSGRRVLRVSIDRVVSVV